MLKMKRVLALVMVFVMAILATGCSTPSVAISVDGRDYSTAEYLAYLYNNAQMIYYYYTNYGGTDSMWTQSLPYSNPYVIEDEEDASKEEDTSKAESEENSLLVPEYLRQQTKDQILYMAAVEALMKEHKLSVSKDDLKEAETALAGYDAETLLDKGFSFDSFKKMYIATTYNEDTLFNGLYGKGGENEVAEKEVRSYFDNNFLAYEIIQITTVDQDGNSLSDKEIADIRSRLEGYYDVYEETGDFDKAIAKYDEDNSPDEEKTESVDTEEDTSSEGGLNWDGTITNVTSNNSENVLTINAETETDQDLVKAVKSVDEGDVEIVEYDQGGTSHMLALIYRIDPDGKGRETYYEDSKESVLRAIKGDEFKKLVVAKMDEQAKKVTISSRAIKMCNPEDFFA